MIEVPATLRDLPGHDDTWGPWLDALPRTAAELLADWQLTLDGPAAHGVCALVLPVRTGAGEAAALKLAWPHDEAETEHLALRRWAGRGAVHLRRADPHRWALLLERAGPADLTTTEIDDACRAVADLYASLHVAPLPQTTRLSAHAARWSRRLRGLARGAPVPRRLVEHAAALCDGFATDPGTDVALLHGDLHYANVLVGDRSPWLAIDPKPLTGDPAYEVSPLLWNRWDEVLADRSPRRALLRRLHVVQEAAGLDPDRTRDWVIVREMVRAVEELTGDGDAVTRSVTIVKAVQDL